MVCQLIGTNGPQRNEGTTTQQDYKSTSHSMYIEGYVNFYRWVWCEYGWIEMIQDISTKSHDLIFMLNNTQFIWKGIRVFKVLWLKSFYIYHSSNNSNDNDWSPRWQWKRLEQFSLLDTKANVLVYIQGLKHILIGIGSNLLSSSY